MLSINNDFSKIKEKYDEFQNHLLKTGRIPAKDTGIGYWGVTPVAELFELFKRIGLHRCRSFLDMGSGDGRVVHLASLFSREAHGIEFDNELVNISTDIRRSLDFPSVRNTSFKLEDFMSHDLSAYDMIYISPDKPFSRSGTEAKLRSELKGKLIVHGWEFLPATLYKEDEHIINGEKFSIYSNA
ncbi:hypothetical protein JXB31_00975 [Candidatus Woesearchaeota archaeon]|nr:hypothetical protein [Candidatus Woesearchaeota archaeon]